MCWMKNADPEQWGKPWFGFMKILGITRIYDKDFQYHMDTYYSHLCTKLAP